MTEGKQPEALARATIIALWVWIAAEAGGIAAAALRLAGLAAMPGTSPAAPGEDPWMPEVVSLGLGLFAGLYVVLFIAVSVVILRWVYQTNAIAQTFDGAMKITPGWNVGWFFVPIAGLFKPFQGLREAWEASVSTLPAEPDDVPASMRWWWGLFIVQNLMSNASFRLSMSAATAADQMVTEQIDLVTGIIGIVQSLCLIATIRRFAAVQSSRLNQLAFG